jgi:hypothetical protein
VGNWLAARFTLFGVTFQNWMTVALGCGVDRMVETAIRSPQLAACVYLMSAGPRQVWVWGSRTRPLPQPPTRSLAEKSGTEIVGVRTATPAVTTFGKAGLV